MTKKDYELIASSVRRMSSLGVDNMIYIADMLAQDLYKANPRFDRNKFFEACGVNLTIPVYVNKNGKTVYA